MESFLFIVFYSTRTSSNGFKAPSVVKECQQLGELARAPRWLRSQWVRAGTAQRFHAGHVESLRFSNLVDIQLQKSSYLLLIARLSGPLLPLFLHHFYLAGGARAFSPILEYHLPRLPSGPYPPLKPALTRRVQKNHFEFRFVLGSPSHHIDGNNLLYQQRSPWQSRLCPDGPRSPALLSPSGPQIMLLAWVFSSRSSNRASLRTNKS
jgi:hypothetical protein